MGLATDLGYRHRTPNALQRTSQLVGSTKAGAWAMSKSLPPLDRLLHRVRPEGTSLPAMLAGLPVLMVTTTGRKSGQPRLTPLISVPLGDDLTLLGTNFGGARTPAWVVNLEADPRATVEYRGTTMATTARPATDDERAQVWAASSGIYGGYEKYHERVRGREIRVFVLEPATP